MPTPKKTTKSSGSKQPNVRVSDLKPSKDAKGGLSGAGRRQPQPNAQVGRQTDRAPIARDN